MPSRKLYQGRVLNASTEGSYLQYCRIAMQITTTIGYGSPNKANSYNVHGSALGAKEVQATRQNLGWHNEPFFVPEDVKRFVLKGMACTFCL